MLPFHLTICGEPDIARTLDRHTHAVSIMDPGMTAQFGGHLPEPNILRLNFHDLDRALPADHPVVRALRAKGLSLVLPDERHVQAILDFGARLEPGDRVLIHCMAGISRSTAAAWMIGAQANPGHEVEVYAHIKSIRPQALPNRLMVSIADRLLRAEGRMVRVRG